MRTLMDNDRLDRLLAAYGADPARWPQGERAAAMRLFAERPRPEALAAASRIDGLLDAWVPASASLSLRERIAASAPRPRGEKSVWRSPMFWLSGAGLAAAGVMGLMVGVSLSEGHGRATTNDDGDVIAAVFDSAATSATLADAETT
jgi:hypothetical protein